MPEKPFELLYYKKAIYASWELRENALAYEILLKSGEKELCRKRFDADDIHFPVCLMNISGDEEYEGELLTILDSEMATCRIPNPLRALKTINENLEKTKTGNDYIVEEKSFYCEIPNAADKILKLLRDGLKLDKLTLKCATAPTLDEDKLILLLKGECECRENIKSMQLTFTVSEDGELLLKISATLGENWKFSQLFTELSAKVFDRLKINNPWFCLDDENGFMLGGTLALSDNADKLLELDWKCKVDNTGEQPTFELLPLKPFTELSWGNISLHEAGRGLISFKPIKLLIYNKCSNAVWEDKSAILCKADIGGSEALYEVTVPLINEEKDDNIYEVTATLTGEQPPFDLISTCVNEMGGSELSSLLPTVLLLSGLDIRKYEIQTEGIYSPCSRRVLEAALPDITLLPSIISLKNTMFSLTTFYNEVGSEQVKRYYKALVKADIEIGTAVIKTELEIPDNDSWELVFRPDPEYSVLTAASTLLGFDKSSAFTCLPSELFKVFDVSLKEFSVIFDPFNQELKYIHFDVGQCGQWELLPNIFTLYGWGADVRMRQIKDGFKTSALVKGGIRLGSGEHAPEVYVNIPLGEGISDIRLRMESGKVFLPTVQDIFEVCGLSGINDSLPDGFAALGKPCMDDFEVVITQEKTVSVRSVYVSFQTTENWVMLSKPSMILKNASARILYNAEKKKITGTIWGKVSIYDTDIDIRLTNTGKSSEWNLSVSSFSPVHIPGIAQLEDWLMQGEFQTCIPQSLMPFPKGLNISRFSMKCNLSAKTMDYIGFTIENCGDWNVIPSLLTLKEAVVESDFKNLSSSDMDLKVQVRVGLQLGGNKILMKLESGNAHSEKDTILTGSLDRAYTEPISLNEIIGTKAEEITSLPICSDFVIPMLESLKVSANITKEQYTVFADVQKLGQLGLAMVKEADKWEYFVAFKLKENFIFADIIPSLSVVDDVFRIEKAGMVLASYESKSLAMALETVKECKDLCPKEGLEAKKLKRGLMVYGQLEIKSSGFADILELGDEMDPNLIINLSACFSEKAEETVFSGSLNEFTILKLLKFRNINLEYIPEQGQSFKLNGEISLSVNNTDYAFFGAMDVNKERGAFIVNTLHEIDNPLGIHGISIKELALVVKCEFETEKQAEKKTTIALKGKVGLGKKDETGTEPLVLEGGLLYDNEDFQIVQVALSQPLSMDRLFESFITKEVWPADLLSITFLNGVLYYAKKECTIDKIYYKKGIHLATEIDIYGFSFLVGVDVLDDGVTVLGAAKAPIDFSFASFTDARYSGGGPGVYICTTEGKKELGLQGGITLFGENFLSVPTFFYLPEKSEFGGTIHYDGNIELFKGAISFTWSEKNGFQLTDWPMQWITDTLDYAKLIEKASRMTSSECDAIVDLVWSETITTKCKVTPKFGTGGEKNGLPLSLKVEYELLVKNKSVVKTDIGPLNVQIPMPEKLTFSELAEVIYKTLADNTAEVIKQIFQDTVKLTEFLALIAVTSCGKKAISSLICRGLKTDVSGRISSSKAIDYANKAKDISKGGGGSGGGSSGGSGIAGAAGAAAEAGAAAGEAEIFLAAAAGFFATLFLIFIGSSEKERAKEAEQEAKKEKERAEKAEREARDAVKGMLKINNLTCVADRTNQTVTVNWSQAASGELGVTYTVIALQNTVSRTLYNNKLSATSCTFSYYPTEEVEDITVKVYASYSYNEKKGKHIYNGETAVQTLYTDIRFTAEQTYNHEKLQFSWKPVKTADEYILVLQTIGGKEIKRYESLKNNNMELDLLNEDLSFKDTPIIKFIVLAVSKELKDTSSFENEILLPERNARIQSLTERLKDEKKTKLEVCYSMLRQFSDIAPERLAAIVKELFTETTAEILADILYLMFERPKNPMLVSAYELKINGMDYLTAARTLKTLYPSITAEDMADIMDLW